MLKLNVNEEKQLNFEIQIGGVQTDQIKSTLRLEIDGVQYGFPAVVGQESIQVDLPALNTVVAKRLKEGTEVQAHLDIIADGHHLSPWSDSFILTNPLVIEAKIVDVGFKEAPAFKTRMVTKGESGDRSQGVMIEKEIVEKDEKRTVTETEEEMTERIVNKLAEKLSPMMQGSGGTITEDKAVKKAVKSSKKEVVKEEKAIEPVKKVSKVDVKNITEEGVYAYMARAGTKNETVQRLIYEQAEVAAGSSKPVEVLRQVVKLLKSKK
jgi:hypothetical protein